ncbi:TetR/AcrR family transcriptional regulator [Novosphingobium sp. YJ-S2-02]|uniref:TetR/AcrR family transcriptional regulator n=1 Tax=Novosphingobium aureum TaxID=2792964 RepID=A0A931HFW5_9SPHN|nr:TetR/AcrR family transcriptional regulator [Novosphingobium aureum]MBH0114606.1 TetR/AcrR family transcriptional regulator [Novosphingobium aureum]
MASKNHDQEPVEAGVKPSVKGGAAPKSAKAEARREAILRGVTEIITRDGYRHQSLRELAKALGMEAQHVLYYFGNREELLQGVIELWDADSVRDPDLAGMVLPSLDLYVAAVRRSCAAPGIGYLYLSLAANAVVPSHPAHEFMKARQEMVRRDLVAAIEAEQAAGTIAQTIDAKVAARQLSALANGLQLQALINPDCDPAGDMAAAIRHLRGQVD